MVSAKMHSRRQGIFFGLCNLLDNIKETGGDKAEQMSISEQNSTENKGINVIQKNGNLGRNLRTTALALGYFNLGYTIVIYGQALPTLAENLKKGVSEISGVIVARGTGFLCGALSIGLAEGKLDNEYAISLSIAISSIGLFFIPTILNYATLIIFSFVNSFGTGAFESIGCVFCLKLWGDQAQSAVQFLYFCYCMGCVVSPLTSRPFLNEAQNTTSNNGTEVFRDVIYADDTNLPYLSVIYIIAASIGILISMYFLFLKYFFGFVSNVVDEEQEKEENNKRFRYKILILMFLSFLVYSGMYLSVVTFLYTFAVSDTPETGYSREEASNLNTVFLIGETVGQFLSIFIAKKFSSTVNITLNTTIAFFVSIGLLLFPSYSEYKIILWILLGLHGLLLTSIYGCFYSWANEYIIVDERASSIFTIGSAFGQTFLVLIPGLFIDKNPTYFLYTPFVCIVILIILYQGTAKMARNYGSRSERRKMDFDVSGTDEILLESKV